MRAFVFAGAFVSFISAAAMADFVPGAALMNPVMSGNTSYDGWIGLTAANYAGYGGFPGTGAWPAGVGSNRTTANTFNKTEPGDAELIKVSNGTGGGPYLAGASIYFGGFSGDFNNYGGTLGVTDATPVANLANVVFQVQIGEAWTHDFYNDALPTLSINGGAQHIVPTKTVVVERFYNGTVDMPTGPEDVYINTYALQWDLRGVTDPITSIRVEFTGVQHAQVYGAQLNQSDVYTTIPSVSTGVIFTGGVVAAVRRRR
jgi:hypothetical protein